MYQHLVMLHASFITAPVDPSTSGGPSLMDKLAFIFGTVLSIGMAIRAGAALYKHPGRNLEDTGKEATNIGWAIVLGAGAVMVQGITWLHAAGSGINWFLG